MDKTENIRRKLCQEINSNPSDRKLLEDSNGKVWDMTELRKDFEVLAFAAPLIIVKRKSDEQKGSLFFQDQPRYYYGFQEDK